MNLNYCYILLVCGLLQLAAAADYNTNNRPQHRTQVNRTLAGSEAYCQKLYDRVLTLSSLDEQQIRQLETLDSRVVRMESSTKERLDAMHAALALITERTEAFDLSKSEAVLNHLRGEIEAMRQHLGNDDFNVRATRQQQQGNNNNFDNNRFPVTDAYEAPNNITAMLNSLAAFLASVRQGVFKIEANFDQLQANVSTLLQLSRNIQRKQHGLPGKQFINHAIANSDLCGSHQSIYGRGIGDAGLSAASRLPSGCDDIQIKDNQINKIDVQSNGLEPFYVKCFANEEYDRGWTVIMNRVDGTINFYRHWSEYKLGFGNIAGEFFIGLDKLHAITSSRVHELLILMQDYEADARIARYSTFAIAGEAEDYALHLLGTYDGTAGDSLTYSASYKFSTFDNDNDGWVEGNCAQSHTGAWWYNACEMSNLMGQYLRADVESKNLFQGMYWNSFHGSNYSLYAVTMMIRPVDYADLSL